MLSAILVAAGDSRRMGFDKLFATIAGRPVIAYTIHAFERADCVGEIIVVARKDRLDEIKAIVRDGNFKKVRSIIPGGKHRQDSVRAGLNHLEAGAKYVAVHDAARPLITTEQIERVFEQCRMHAAASLAEPISDTLKYADSEFFVAGPVDRHQLYAMQAPQVVVEFSQLQGRQRGRVCRVSDPRRRDCRGRCAVDRSRYGSTTG